MRNHIIAIIRYLSKVLTQLILLFPHNKKYFIFTSKYGFSDNTKYLFLYYLERGSRCIWVASDDNCYYEVTKLIENYPNANVVKKKSFKLLFTLIKAKYVFVNHSFLDFGAIAVKSCPVINLWHGIPIKKMGYDSINDIKLYDLDLVNPYEINDFVIASSETTKPFFQSCMKLSSDKIIALGQPRNEYLFDNKNNDELHITLKSHYSESSEVRTFLYAPTFRDKNNLSMEIYGNLINSFTNNAQERDILVLRLHPKEKELLRGIKLPNKVKLSVIKDVQEELLATDILISDYSSIIFDFSILARPILLYAPDRDNYFLNRGGSYFKYESILQECDHIDLSRLDSIWNLDFKTINFTKLMSLHSVFACKNIYNKFN